MNALVNRVQLIGQLGQDPEVKNLENGNKMARFSLATNEHRKNAEGERITDTQWHNIVAWGKAAELIEKYAHKGNKVAVDGKLVNRNYEDKDGIKRYITEVQLNEVLFLSGKNS